jgi:hypothetical protein
MCDYERLWESDSRVNRSGSGIRIQDSGFRIQDSGFRIQASPIPDSGFEANKKGRPTYV